MLGRFYSEVPSWLHRVPVGRKLLALAVFGTGVLWLQSLPVLLGILGACGVFWWSLGAATRPVRGLLTRLCVAAALVCVLHIALQQAGVGVASFVRLVCAGLLALSVSVSTAPTDLLDWLEKFFAPLRRWGVKPERLALRIALMLRFVELFFSQWQRLDDAHRLRTGRRGGWRLLAPLTILMLLAARRVADTLQVRLGE